VTQQIVGMAKEKLINCDTHFSNDQIEAIIRVLEDLGYSDMYEALKEISAGLMLNQDNLTMDSLRYVIKASTEIANNALAKAEGK